VVDLLESLRSHVPSQGEESRDLARIISFVESHPEPFARSIREGHLTGSAVVVSADGSRVLLLFHKKLSRWLQPGGHGDPGETRGEEVALREALEETGIAGLALHASAPRPLDVDVHEIPARGDEPAHQHLDLRYLFVAPADATLQRAALESSDLRWFGWDEAAALGLDAGLTRLLRKARAAL